MKNQLPFRWFIYSLTLAVYITLLLSDVFQLALKFHPDKNQGDEAATEKVSTAWTLMMLWPSQSLETRLYLADLMLLVETKIQGVVKLKVSCCYGVLVFVVVLAGWHKQLIMYW